ncbi:MAG: hypothetical protein RSF67_09880 [Clostridia bacterium]
MDKFRRKKEANILGALDFYTNQKDELQSIFEIVSTLSKVKLIMNKTNFKVNIPNNILIKYKSNILILILLEIIIYLSDNKVELIGMDVVQNSKNEIVVLNKFIEKIN